MAAEIIYVVEAFGPGSFGKEVVGYGKTE